MTVGEFLKKLDFNFNEFSPDSVLNKKILACIVHGFLIQVLKEKDEEDWSAARILKDIYECHTCVMHIAQVYVKGIVPPDSNSVYGVNKEVSQDLMQKVFERIFDPKKRIAPPKLKLPEIKKISFIQTQNLIFPRFIDVRFNPEISSVPGKSIMENITLKNIVQNPYILGPDLQQNIVLYCTKGYQSTLAADVLTKAGYLNVFVISC